VRFERLPVLKLQIPNNIFEQMLVQARAEAPVEACGILAGADGKAQKLYKMTNAEASTEHFMMKPEEQFRVVKEIRKAGLEMLAIYHSHPASGARPSAEDMRMALTPGVVYLIISLLNNQPMVKGFIIEDGNVSEVPVEILEK